MDEKNQDSIGYAFKGKIMITSITILFFACFVIVAFHVCRRRRSDRHLRRRAGGGAGGSGTGGGGLDRRAVKSLPTFLYKSENQESAPPPPECAVCLSDFEEGETGRILPECRHSFHVECIDAWLRSHRHCPLCRARVKGRPDPGPPDCIVVSINEPAGHGSGSSSENPDPGLVKINAL